MASVSLTSETADDSHFSNVPKLSPRPRGCLSYQQSGKNVFVDDPMLSDDVPYLPVATISVAILMLVQLGVVFRTSEALVAVWAFDRVLDPEIGPA